MCDNKNNKNVYQQQQTWLLKPLLQLLLLGVLIQQQQQNVVLVNATPEAATAAAFQPSYIEHGKDALSLASTSLLVQQQQNVATFDTKDVVDSSLSTARKLLAVDGDISKVEGSGSAVVGTLTDIEDDRVENTDVDKNANDEDMDRIEFSGYVNDFNMQREASIPEDILDQQHIEDEQENAEGDGEENIILESQRSTIRNFTSSNNNNNNNNNENHGNNNKNYNSDVDDDNGSNNYKRKKKKTNNNNSSNKNQHKKLSNNKNNQHHHFEISVEIENDEPPNADDNSESLQNEKLGNRQQHHHQQQHQQQLQAVDQQQQLDDNVHLNELKFNKLTVVENLNDNEDDDDDDAADVVDFKWSSNNNKEQQQQQQYKYDEKQQNDEQVKAIGDIEDNNSFRKETAWEAEITNDNDASAAVAVATGDGSTNNDTDDDEIADATTVPRTTTAKTIVFVGRKTKRHGTALSTQKQQQQQEQFMDVADQQYDEEQQQMIYDKQDHSRHHHFNSDSSRSSNNNNMPTLQDDLDQEQTEQKQKLLVKPDYSISYFGISTSNGSSTSTQKDMRVGATNVESFSMSDSSSSNSKGQDVLKFINEDGVTLSQHSDYVTPTLTAFEQHKAQRRNNRRTGHKSHKKKYKDYLRYVKATATTTTTAAITGKSTTIQAPTMAKVVMADIATIPAAMEEKELRPEQQQHERQQQRLAKLKQYKNDIKSMEKTRQLPAASSPIFVLTNRRANAATTDVLAAGSSSVSEVTIRPYYEGQLSYYMETRDDEDETKNMPGNNVGKLITSETGSNNWYRRMQPILRNGMTKQRDNKREHNKHHHHHHHLHEHHLKQHQQHGAHHQHQHHHHNHHSQSLQREHRKHLHEEHQQHQESDSSDSVRSSQKEINLDKSVQHHAYQRRLSATKKEQQPPYRPHYTPYVPLEAPTAPLPAPSYHAAQQQKSSSDGALRELGHQITQMEEFDRYYRKWPHLARVQYQLNDENYRAAHGGALLDADSETEYEYQLAGDEIEDEFDTEDDDDEDDDAEDANLPPYIKKYNRRNKQLLNLLEGTLPPPTPPKRIIWSSSVLQPGPRDSAPVRVDDDYIKEKRRRYHKQHNGNTKQWSGTKDLFAEQRDASEKLSDTSVNDDTTAPTTAKATVQTALPRQTLNLHVTQDGQQQPSQQPPLNVIPGDDVDMSSSSSQEFDDWEKEIATSVKGSEKMKWQIENSAAATTTVATPTATTTLKPAVFRLPSYPGFAGSFIGKPRSRSSQFAPSSGSSIISSGSSSSRLLPGIAGNRAGNSFITNALHAGNYKSAMNIRDSSISSESNNNIAPPTSVPPSSSVTVAVAAKPLSNSFVYHRVEASPRAVGAGFTGHKQRLPFVAITDRRLETSKKSFALLERQRSDFEQNHYPMP